MKINQQCAAILEAHLCALYPWKAKWRFSLLEMLVQVHPNRFDGLLSLRREEWIWFLPEPRLHIFIKLKEKMWVEFNQLEHFRNGIPGHFHHDRIKCKLSLCTWPWFWNILSPEGYLHFPAAVPTLRNPGYCWACPSGGSQILEHCFFKKVIRKLHADSILTLQHISTILKETIPWLFLFV